MTASRVEDPMPPTPIQLRWCITEASRVDIVVERVLNTHYRVCPRRQEVAAKCSDGLCQYFTWHLNHHTSHRQVVQHCEHCAQFESWIEKHEKFCSSRSPCGLSLCSEVKKRSLKGRFHPSLTGFHKYMSTSPSSSLNQEGDFSYHPPPSHSEVTSPADAPDDINDGYDSGTPSSSASTSPSSTQFIAPAHDPETPISHLRFIQSLQRQPSVPSVHPSDPSTFCRTKSTSITQESLTYMRQRGMYPRDSSGSDISQGESQEEKDRYRPHRIDSLDPPLPLPTPLSATALYPSHAQRPTYGGAHWPANDSAHPKRQPDSSKKEKRQSETGDSAIGSSTSTSENEMSSLESEAVTAAEDDTLESVSTPSTLHASFGNSGSSGLTVSPMEPGTNASVLPHGPKVSSVEEHCKIADELLETYSEALTMLDNRGRPIFVDDPPSPARVASHNCVYLDHDWREGCTRPPQTHQPPSQNLFYDYTEDEATIEKSLDHRASVREFLQGQFYLQQTYREHVHWNRVQQIGHGGQAKCFSIEDNTNKYLLCLKEETENRKTLDETFICLKLAMLVRDAPQNIVEFFGASILPHYNGNNHLQLFLELMPGCLQGFVFENGPLSPETTLNYSYQLFEALDYLHQRLKVIHCDIKPANLLIDYNCQRLKVADFGCAELLEECGHAKGFPENKDAGTLWYNPPEFYCTGNCSFGMDIWQAGCSVLYMITGRRPWRHLCMDVNKSRATPSQATTMKKQYCQLIGDRRENYPLPGFLTSGVRQLLSGCLRSEGRLSAKDCVYMAALSEATDHEQKTRIVEKLGYTPSQDVLERLQSTVGQQTTVDVYLGKERCNANVNGVPHAILNGWLGSVPYQNRMTYRNLLDLVKRYLPVTRNFGDCGLAISGNNPQAIRRSVNATGKPHMVRPDQLVDPSRAFLLLPRERTFT